MCIRDSINPIAKHAQELSVHPHDPALGIGYRNAFRGCLHQLVEKRSFPLNLFFRLLALGDVPDDMDQPDALVVSVKPWYGPDFQIPVKMRFKEFKGARLLGHETSATGASFGRFFRAVVTHEAFCVRDEIAQERQPQHLTRTAVRTDNVKILVMNGHHVCQAVEGAFPVVSCLQERRLRLLAVRDISADAQRSYYRTVRRAQDDLLGQKSAELAIITHSSELALARTCLDGNTVIGHIHCCFFGLKALGIRLADDVARSTGVKVIIRLAGRDIPSRRVLDPHWVRRKIQDLTPLQLCDLQLVLRLLALGDVDDIDVQGVTAGWRSHDSEEESLAKVQFLGLRVLLALRPQKGEFLWCSWQELTDIGFQTESCKCGHGSRVGEAHCPVGPHLNDGVRILRGERRQMCAADTALNYFAMAHRIEVADELHVDAPPVRGLQRQVFITDVLLLLQFQEVGLVRHDALEEPQVPDVLPKELVAGEPQHLGQECIHVHDHAGVSIQDQNAVLGSLEQTAIASLRSAQLLLHLLALGDLGQTAIEEAPWNLCCSNTLSERGDPNGVAVLVPDTKFARTTRTRSQPDDILLKESNIFLDDQETKRAVRLDLFDGVAGDAACRARYPVK